MARIEGDNSFHPTQEPNPETPQEIERKFLIPTLPDNIYEIATKITHIDQGYLAITQDGTEVRLRKSIEVSNEQYFLSVRRGDGLVRKGLETELMQEQFVKMWDGTEGQRISKTRLEIPYGPHNIELDIYEGENLGGLITAEIEFPSIQESAAFVAPEWFGEDVTLVPDFKNQNLALFGNPIQK